MVQKQIIIFLKSAAIYSLIDWRIIYSYIHLLNLCYLLICLYSVIRHTLLSGIRASMIKVMYGSLLLVIWCHSSFN